MRKDSLLDQSVRLLGYESYKAYLCSPHWQDFCKRWTDAGMSRRCAACDFPHTVLHHVTYRRLGKEELGDVIPLCDRCHRYVHRYHRRHKLPLICIHRSLGAVFCWTEEQCKKKLSPFRHLRKRRIADRDWKVEKAYKQEQKEKKEIEKKQEDLLEKSPRCRNDYYKIARDLTNFTKYIDEGYPIPELAYMYGVSITYVKGYLRKFQHLFIGAKQLEQLDVKMKKKKREQKMVNVSIAELWNQKE